ncbi:MAG: hypothetical protein AAGJ87_12370 [Pseudomonadota bacterium]
MTTASETTTRLQQSAAIAVVLISALVALTVMMSVARGFLEKRSSLIEKHAHVDRLQTRVAKQNAQLAKRLDELNVAPTHKTRLTNPDEALAFLSSEVDRFTEEATARRLMVRRRSDVRRASCSATLCFFEIDLDASGPVDALTDFLRHETRLSGVVRSINARTRDNAQTVVDAAITIRIVGANPTGASSEAETR